MEMKVTKNAGKPHIILYVRNDGSQTWMQADDFFVMHDLSHYALEKTLGYSTAFMGMLNDGMDIKDFEDREKRRQIIVSKEAAYSENMANLLLVEILQGNFENFNEVSGQVFETSWKNFPVPHLSDEEINSVRTFLRQLLKQWKELPAGETMILNFEI
ncbi:MAG TPA: hypothetical protein VHD35_13220 [Chitinophagaceae bacterium]|nr:hypothetical protein [Chitinophagaceae bacterium]